MRNMIGPNARLASGASSQSSLCKRNRPTNRSLRFESLESRRLLAVFTVTNLDDDPVAAAGDAPGTLRQALFDANATSEADTINFQGGLTGTITLTEGELSVVQPVDIVGPGAELLTIDASGNDATAGVSDGGGTRVLNIDNGDFNDVIDVQLSGLTLTGGDVSGDGGGIRSRENLTLSNSTVSGNSAVETDTKGGGIASYGGNLSIDASTISGNSAIGSNADGGGIHLATLVFGQQSTEITNSTISDNTATRSGGGVFSSNTLTEDQAAEIVNSTISGNTAGAAGGGLYNFDGATIIRHSTVTDNTAGLDLGSGISTYGDVATSTQLRSSIVSGNNGVDLAVVSADLSTASNTFVSNEYNLIGTGNSFGPGNAFTALDNFNAAGDQPGVLNPGLAALADNGGFTWTHALLPSSPAVDAGDLSAQANVADVPEFDQRGTPFGRVSDGNGDSTATIDIGAFELGATIAPPSADFDEDMDVDGDDFLAWQRGFGTLAPNAMKSDGDADNDLDTDGDDLLVWEAQYGQPALVAAVSSTVGVEPNNEVQPLASLTYAASSTLRSMQDKTVESEDELQVVVDVSQGALPTKVIFQIADPLVSAGASTQGTDELATDNREAFFDSFPHNFISRFGAPVAGLHENISDPGTNRREATGCAEHLDMAFGEEWDSLDIVGHISLK